MVRKGHQLGKSNCGATAMEYAMIAGLIAFAILIVLSAMGEEISFGFNTVAAAIS